jgi:hypothetical protein
MNLIVVIFWFTENFLKKVHIIKYILADAIITFIKTYTNNE